MHTIPGVRLEEQCQSTILGELKRTEVGSEIEGGYIGCCQGLQVDHQTGSSPVPGTT
jgi:hypothetical protein